MRQEDMEKILRVGVLLSSERDLNRLLEQILVCVMELAACDAGTLYLREGDALRFEIMRNDTLNTYSGGTKGAPNLPPVPLSCDNVCAMALLEDRTICIEDVKNNKDYDFSGPIRYDAMTGYNTRSMLVVPMRNREGERIGVLQLINALDEEGNVCAFAPDMALVVESVASQAAITIQNVRYMEEIKDLFQSFVRVMSAAVDERTPYNASHARHMAECGGRFVDYLGACEGQRSFSADEKEEFLMSILLHDIGKLVTPLEVMNKAKRLLPEQYSQIDQRMEAIRLRAEIAYLSGYITLEEKEQEISRTKDAWALIQEINTAGFVRDELLGQLEELRGRTYRDREGREHPWIESEEYAMLSIRKGTLSEEERGIMEEHVSITDRLLSQIHFSNNLSHVREWAAAHHEFLNGTGYPRHMQGDEVPYEVRMITILDIFDSLVADDRPYKRAMPVERALSILKSMAEQEGKLDKELTELFIRSRCWEA
ncbi:GAF domain-containing protein [bacterium 1XD21-13]|nr:GAF domain-containing protein [bacterium 1XD21-13]